MSTVCFELINKKFCFNDRKVKELRVETDSETGVKNYVQMDDPTADQINFIQGPCPGKSVLYISCMDLGIL